MSAGDRAGPTPSMASPPGAAGPGGTDVEGGLVLPPTGGMGGGLGGGMGGGGLGSAGSGLGRAERQRLAYLPQESKYWGTEPGLVTSLRTADGDDDDDDLTEEGFEAVPSRIAGIGARTEPGQREIAATDWRMQ